MNNKFFQKYFSLINEHLQKIDHRSLKKLIELIRITKINKNKLIFAGNGGSAAISSHLAVDFTKAAGIRSINFNEADLITCFANDYKYENWVKHALKFYADNNDLIILISSSGMSKNMINAAKFAKSKKMKVVTFTGFSKNNNLKKIGNLNFWVNSNKYNIIEMTHHIWLLAVVDNICKVKI